MVGHACGKTEYPFQARNSSYLCSRLSSAAEIFGGVRRLLATSSMPTNVVRKSDGDQATAGGLPFESYRLNPSSSTRSMCSPSSALPRKCCEKKVPSMHYVSSSDIQQTARASTQSKRGILSANRTMLKRHKSEQGDKTQSRQLQTSK